MRAREWLRSTDPVAMLSDLLGSSPFGLQGRRLRIFTLTAANPVLERVNHPACTQAAEVGWRLAEGIATADDRIAGTQVALRAAWLEAFEAMRHHYVTPVELCILPCLVNVMALLLKEPDGAARNLLTPPEVGFGDTRAKLLTPEETLGCCWLLRDIFGNPFRPVFLDPSWLTSTVMALAAGIYEERAFDRMPILADALQDAGCDDEAILNHCRGDHRHVRGCWVVDRLLERE